MLLLRSLKNKSRASKPAPGKKDIINEALCSNNRRLLRCIKIPMIKSISLQVFILLIFASVKCHSQVFCNHHPNFINNMTKSNNYCTSNDFYIGQWNLFQSIEQPSYLNCPKTFNNLIGSPKEHAANYMRNSIHHACFLTENNCQIMSLEYSIKAIAKHLAGKRILHIGDSLGGQQFVETSCNIEDIFWYGAINTELLMQTTLMEAGMLCSSNCTNAEFLDSQRGKFPSKCAECPNGSQNIVLDIFSMIKNIKETDVGILILNTGAWYLPCWGVDDPQNAYKKMLELLNPVLQGLVNKGVIVVWMALPESSEELILLNNEAKLILSENVLLINCKDSIGKRISIDSNVTYDGIHFANPGKFTLTNFMNYAIFHLVAMKVLYQHCKFDHSIERTVVIKDGSFEIKTFTVIKLPPMQSAYYLILEDGKRHLIWDWDTFTALGLKLQDVITINEEDFKKIKEGFPCPVIG